MSTLFVAECPISKKRRCFIHLMFLSIQKTIEQRVTLHIRQKSIPTNISELCQIFYMFYDIAFLNFMFNFATLGSNNITTFTRRFDLFDYSAKWKNNKGKYNAAGLIFHIIIIHYKDLSVLSSF